MGKIAFTINSREIEMDILPDDLLIDVLRERLNLTGTKKGCGKGDCGVCTILLNGKAFNACLLPAYKVQGCSIVTIEGIGGAEPVHPIQKAFIDHGAVQCGFCSPGMILSAKALLEQNSNPSAEEIKEAISGNLCRCTGYKKIIEAVREASFILRGKAFQEQKASKKKGSGLIGTPQANILAKGKVLGRTQFGADFQMEGMAYIKILRSPYPHALILRIDTSEAEKVPGVVGVITSKDIPGENWFELIRNLKDQPVLAHEKVRYEGEAIAAVAATSSKIAEEAVDRIHVEYKPLEPVWKASDALLEGAPLIHAQGNLINSRRLVKGDITKGFDEADVVVEESFHTPMVEHAYLEPEAGIAYLDDLGRLVVKTCCQDAHLIQRNLSRILGIVKERIRVVQTDTGGGFGGKIDLTTQGILGAMALKIQKPVRMVLEREESFLSTPKRHAYEMKVKLGAKRDGTFSALHFEVLSDGGAYSSWSQSVLLKSAVHASGPYFIPNILFEGKAVYTNNPFAGAFRGFGVPQVAFALESAIDILANELKLDPLEIRIRNGLDRGLTTATGQVLNHSIGIKKTLEALQKIYQKELKQLREQSDRSPIREGLGLACMGYGIGYTGLPNPSEAEIELLGDGRFRLYIGACDIGQGSSTVMAQIAAEELKVPIEWIEVVSADTDLTPDAWITCASRHTYISGNAVKIAGKKLREALIETASKVLEVGKDQIGVEDGNFYSDLFPSKIVSLKQLYNICRREGILKHRGFFNPEITALDENGQGNPYSTYAFATHLVKVAMDCQTGEVMVRNVWAAHDVGKAINLMAVEGQIEGGVVMGIGYALMEKFIPMVSYNFKKYAIPTVFDMPQITVHIVEEGEPSGPYGAKGLGEPVLIPTAPAIANAIFNAVRVRAKNLPILPEEILRALKKF
jgi:CO/xanthine dehydrogenase Mo-binding subunit/aerobic-type carbon monoxide dehydrogenase small subunit (CoxS/CutS family)